MNLHTNELKPTISIERRGVALVPSMDKYDSAGVLNPGSARTREGKLLLYPRVVEEGNISRVGMYELQANGTFKRLGMALEPEASYEMRDQGDGHGCEDPRVTFIPVLDLYIMSYTAFGPNGPRIAIATSPDALAWSRLGLVDFMSTDYDDCHDKDAAFFPEPVMSPNGIESLAFYHRPSKQRDGSLHEDIYIAYISLEAVKEDLRNLLKVHFTECVLEAGGEWGNVKVGGGTPPMRTSFGWLSLFHGVDRRAGEKFDDISLVYRAGVLIHDIRLPHIVRYVSPQPILSPERALERSGTVNNVVFPTAIDYADHAPDTATIYYGMADAAIGAAFLDFSVKNT